MTDTEPQTAGGKVLWHFTMSQDGFVAGPDYQMDWMTGVSSRPAPGLIEEYAETTGAVLGGRDGWDAAGDSRPYGGAWDGPIFVLTHHPQDATPADGVTFLNCSPAKAVRIGLAAAGGKNLEADHAERKAPNELIIGFPGKIVLREARRRYTARFVNRFQGTAGGTRYPVRGEIVFKGSARLLQPFLRGYVRRQVGRRMLQPVKAAAERPGPAP